MRVITICVDGAPPWKQSPADRDESKRQEQLRKALQAEASAAMKGSALLGGSCAVSIHYGRSEGRADGANIVGGVLDALENIVFKNDRQAVEILYSELKGSKDLYEVTIVELV